MNVSTGNFIRVNWEDQCQGLDNVPTYYQYIYRCVKVPLQNFLSQKTSTWNTILTFWFFELFMLLIVYLPIFASQTSVFPSILFAHTIIYIVIICIFLDYSLSDSSFFLLSFITPSIVFACNTHSPKCIFTLLSL